MRRAALLMVMVAGCVRPDLLACGDQLCNSDQVCYANSRCVSPEQLSQCDGVAEGTACTAPVEGHCVANVCEPATCGDGFIDSDLREVCEPTLISPLQCVDLGFDEGRPGCTDGCEADVTSGCVRYGWTRFLNAATQTFVTNGTTSFWLTGTGLYSQDAAGTIRTLDARQGVLLANGGRTVYESYEVNIPTLYDVTATGLTPIYSFGTPSLGAYAIDDAGVVYIATTLATTTTIGVLGASGALVPIATTTEALGRLVIGSGPSPRVFFLAGNSLNQLWEIDRTTASASVLHTFTDPIAAVSEEPHTRSIWIGTPTGLFTIDGFFFAQLDSNATLNLSTITPLGDFVYVADTGGGVVRYNAVGNGSLRTGVRFKTPSGVRLTTDGTDLYSYGGPVYKFTGTDWSTRGPLPNATNDVLARGDGLMVFMDHKQFAIPRGDGRVFMTSTPTGSNGKFRAIASEGELSYMSTYDDDGSSPVLWQATAGIDGPYSAIAVPGTPVVRSLWRDPASNLVLAVGDQGTSGFLGALPAATWNTMVLPNCTVRAVRNAVAVGGCGDQPGVWTYDTAWHELSRPPLPGVLLSVSAPGDGSIAVVNENGAAVFDGTSWTVDPSVVGEWISGTARTDFFVSGDFTDVQHYNGLYWSRLAVSQVTPIKVLATPRRVMFAGAIGGRVELVR